MEQFDKQLNTAVKDIKNIKMTNDEKNHIFESITKEEHNQENITEKRYNFFQFFTPTSFYMKTAIYLILLVGVGGLFYFNYQNPNQQTNYLSHNYNNNLNNEGGILLQNEEPTPTNDSISTTNIAKNTNPTSNTSITPTTTINNQQQIAPTATGMVALPAPTMVYKTKNDYSNNVSVCYKDNEITCQPGQGFVTNQRPIKLANGYLLKKMPGDVFLGVTIDEFINYSGDLSKIINIDNIIDFKPFVEMYNCPSGLQIEAINELIISGKLKTECENKINYFN
jgi:hypothetical protein